MASEWPLAHPDGKAGHKHCHSELADLNTPAPAPGAKTPGASWDQYLAARGGGSGCLKRCSERSILLQVPTPIPSSGDHHTSGTRADRNYPCPPTLLISSQPGVLQCPGTALPPLAVTRLFPSQVVPPQCTCARCWLHGTRVYCSCPRVNTKGRPPCAECEGDDLTCSA